MPIKTKEEIIKERIANQMRDAEALEEVRETVLSMCGQLPAGFYVGAAQLVPYEKWEKLSRGECSRFGQRLSMLVGDGKLPLIRAKPVGVTKHYLTE